MSKKTESRITYVSIWPTRASCAGCARRCRRAAPENSASGSSISRRAISWRCSGRVVTWSRRHSSSGWTSRRSCWTPLALKKEVHKPFRILKNTLLFVCLGFFLLLFTQRSIRWEHSAYCGGFMCGCFCFFSPIHLILTVVLTPSRHASESYKHPM